MSRSFYRHTVTNIVAEMDDKFARLFSESLEKVTKTEASKSTSVEENAATVAAETEEVAPATKPAKATTKNDSSKEGNN